MNYFRKIIHPKINLNKINLFNIQFSELLNNAFKLKKDENYLTDFPIWNLNFKQKNVIIIGYFKNKQLVSCAGLRIARYFFPNLKKSYLVGLIGAVATHPQERGRGLATRAINELVVLAKACQVKSIFLWSQDFKFYQKLGFAYFGEQIQIPIEVWAEREDRGFPLICPCVGEPKNLPAYSDVWFQRGWSSHLFEHFKGRTEGLILQEEDRYWFGAHQNVEWFFIYRAGAILAYTGLGRGIDMKDRVHEWGGDPEWLKSLLGWLGRFYPQAKLLAHPQHLNQLGLERADFKTAIEPLCIAKNLQFELTKMPYLPKEYWFWGLDAV